MPIELETTVSVPRTSEACLAFSVHASVLLSDPRGWLALQRVAADALIHSQLAGAIDAAALFSIRKGLSDDGGAVSLISLLFVCDGELTGLDAIHSVIDDSGLAWSSDGVQEIPDDAFPSLAFVHGALHQVWLSSPAGPASLSIGWREEGPIVIKTIAKDAAASAFLPMVRHAKVVPGDRKKQVHSREERMKAAFAIRVCERIMDADGQRDAAEVFITKTFNERLLRSLDLLDDSTLDSLYDDARAELRDGIGSEDKLGLMGLFYRVCQADGFIDDRELMVLFEAGAQLGLTREQIDDYIQNVG